MSVGGGAVWRQLAGARNCRARSVGGREADVRQLGPPLGGFGGRVALIGPASNGCHRRSVVVNPLVTGTSPLQRAHSRVQKAARDMFLVVAALALLGSQALSTLHYVLVPHHL